MTSEVVEVEIEERIRRWPVWFARLANRLIGWTDSSCAADCGYPISGRFRVEIEKVGETSVMMAVCSLRGACEQSVRENPRDEFGRRYPEFRPEIVAAIRERKQDAPVVLISH